MHFSSLSTLLFLSIATHHVHGAHQEPQLSEALSSAYADALVPKDDDPQALYEALRTLSDIQKDEFKSLLTEVSIAITHLEAHPANKTHRITKMVLQFKKDVLTALVALQAMDLEAAVDTVLSEHRRIYQQIVALKQSLPHGPSSEITLTDYSVRRELLFRSQQHIQLVTAYAFFQAIDEDHVAQTQSSERRLEAFLNKESKTNLSNTYKYLAKKDLEQKQKFEENYNSCMPSFPSSADRRKKIKLKPVEAAVRNEAIKVMSTIIIALKELDKFSNLEIAERAATVCEKAMRLGKVRYMQNKLLEQERWNETRNAVLHFGIRTKMLLTLATQSRQLHDHAFALRSELENLEVITEKEARPLSEPHSASSFAIPSAQTKEEAIKVIRTELADLHVLICNDSASLAARLSSITDFKSLYASLQALQVTPEGSALLECVSQVERWDRELQSATPVPHQTALAAMPTAHPTQTKLSPKKEEKKKTKEERKKAIAEDALILEGAFRAAQKASGQGGAAAASRQEGATASQKLRTLTDTEGKIRTGVWKNGKLIGQGSISYPNGTREEGTWGLENGIWTLTGQGSISNPDGTREEGTWGLENGVWTLTGQGSISYPDGKRDEGIWGFRIGKWRLTGQGTISYPNGLRNEGIWGLRLGGWGLGHEN